MKGGAGKASARQISIGKAKETSPAAKRRKSPARQAPVPKAPAPKTGRRGRTAPAQLPAIAGPDPEDLLPRKGLDLAEELWPVLLKSARFTDGRAAVANLGSPTMPRGAWGFSRIRSSLDG